MTDLADHIEQTHHQYMKSELPQLDAVRTGASDPQPDFVADDHHAVDPAVFYKTGLGIVQPVH